VTIARKAKSMTLSTRRREAVFRPMDTGDKDVMGVFVLAGKKDGDGRHSGINERIRS